MLCGKRPALVLLGLGALLVGKACSSGEVSVRSASARTEVDLGVQPPLLRMTIRSELVALEESRRFERVFTSCGCLGAKLFADQSLVPVGATVRAGQALGVVAEFEGRGHAGRSEESVRLFFTADDAGAAPVERELAFHCLFDRDESLVGGKSPLLFVALPGGQATETLELREPLAGGELRVAGPDWLRAELLSDGSPAEPRRLQLQAGPVEVAGLYEADLFLPIAKDATERVPVRIRVVSPEVLRPERVSMRLPAGATQELPLFCSGKDVAVEAAAVDWGWEEDGGASASLRPSLELDRGADSAGGANGQGLVLRVRAGSRAGMYKGRALIRPRPGSRYRLSLPWLVRVTAGVSAALPGSGESGR